MTAALAERLRELLAGDAGETASGLRFLPLVTLDSGARCGLDAEARWVLAPADGAPVAFSLEHAALFHEPVETPRDRFDAALEEGARAHGLAVDEVVLFFPAGPIVSAVLGRGWPYLTRLALLWLRPSELREVRAQIVAVARASGMPAPIRELAERLIVAE